MTPTNILPKFADIAYEVEQKHENKDKIYYLRDTIAKLHMNLQNQILTDPQGIYRYAPQFQMTIAKIQKLIENIEEAEEETQMKSIEYDD